MGIDKSIHTKDTFMRKEQILQGLENRKEQLNIEIYEKVTSTNSLLVEMARQGVAEGKVIVAHAQTLGKGRSGRSFYSPEGSGLYFSILLRPKMQWKDALLITTAAAVATVKGIYAVTGISTGIKWVNDIFYQGKKVCGILTESAIDPATGTLDYAVLGIGMNLTEGESGFPKELEGVAGTLFGEKNCEEATKAKLIAEILKVFLQEYQCLLKREFMKDYKAYSLVIGRQVEAYTEMTSELVTVLDIDEEGALIVQAMDGTIQKLTTGEVRIRQAEDKAVK